jgi:hypothetical protein
VSATADHDRYTVGWICAVFTEYVAAKAFLDERLDISTFSAGKDINDTNAYTLGRIGAHNVVIASLPDGEYGISAAATVATNMLRSFPNVRIGLMVGIGGGVWSPEYDIRLGDVVVSSPTNGKPGIFQYDFGKAVQGEGFQHTGYMSRPPTAVRTAIADIRSEHTLEGHDLETRINAAIEKFPRIRSHRGFKRPDRGTDILCRPEVIHSEACLQTACGEKESNLVGRSPRTSDD